MAAAAYHLAELSKLAKHFGLGRKVYVTNARSFYNYLCGDVNRTFPDKRLAIQLVLLRDAARKPCSHVRWKDGQHNMANVLTGANAENGILRQFSEADFFLCLGSSRRNSGQNVNFQSKL